MSKAEKLFVPAFDPEAPGRDRELAAAYIVQGVPIALTHTKACYDQKRVHAHPPGVREHWGMDIQLPCDFYEATEAQLDKAVLDFFNRFDDPLAPCPECGTMTWNRKHFPSEYRDERCAGCWHKDFAKRMEALHQKELAALAAQDRKQAAAGMRWRYSCWVHPQRGDDFQVDIYTNRPDPQVGPKLKRQYRATLVEVATPVALG